MSASAVVEIDDEPTERTRFDQLVYDKQQALLESIRERRLATLRVYEDLVAKKQASANEKLVLKAGKLQVRIKKKLDAATKALDEIDAMSRDISAMKLQLENE